MLFLYFLSNNWRTLRSARFWSNFLSKILNSFLGEHIQLSLTRLTKIWKIEEKASRKVNFKDFWFCQNQEWFKILWTIKGLILNWYNSYSFFFQLNTRYLYCRLESLNFQPQMSFWSTSISFIILCIYCSLSFFINGKHNPLITWSLMDKFCLNHILCNGRRKCR